MNENGKKEARQENEQIIIIGLVLFYSVLTTNVSTLLCLHQIWELSCVDVALKTVCTWSTTPCTQLGLPSATLKEYLQSKVDFVSVAVP